MNTKVLLLSLFPLGLFMSSSSLTDQNPNTQSWRHDGRSSSKPPDWRGRSPSVAAVMDWLRRVAGLSALSAMIVSWRLSPVAAEADWGDGWRRPSLNRRRPPLPQQVCCLAAADTSLTSLHTYPSCLEHTSPSACSAAGAVDASLQILFLCWGFFFRIRCSAFDSTCIWGHMSLVFRMSYYKIRT